MATTKDKLIFIHAMARHTSASVRQCEALMRYAVTLNRYDVERCNREETEADKRKVERIQKRVVELCLEITGRRPLFTWEPMASPFITRARDGYSNSPGGEGIAVPS